MKKALLVTGISAVVGLASVGGVVSAATTGGPDEVTAQVGGTSIIDKLASHFNLDKNEVKAVFEEHHGTMDANLQARIEEKLNKAVEAGYITEAQKTAILEKHDELKTYRESIKAKHDELRKWAEENDLTKFAHFLGGFGHGNGEHKLMIKGEKEVML